MSTVRAFCDSSAVTAGGVVGNGMAGARAVEEVLARGGSEMFDIVMFGDEPYGNYNRILLSNVLNGSQDPGDIFLNPLAWYADHGVTLHAGQKVTLRFTATEDNSSRTSFLVDDVAVR